MTKKQIIESLKAMELTYSATDTVEKLQAQLDDALGTSKKPIELKKVEDKKVTDTSGKVEFSDIIAYQKLMRNKRLGL